MQKQDYIDLVLLAALWGASFLFMRASVHEFGAIPMIFMRVLLAGLFLLPFLILKNQQQKLRSVLGKVSMVGVMNSAIPFTLIAYSTLFISAGFASVINAATPLFTAIVAFLWLKQRLSVTASFGLLIGLLGVVLLVQDKIAFTPGASGFAIIAGISSTICYGIAANYAKKYLAEVPSLVITVGSQMASAIFLLPMAVYYWPDTMPSLLSWINVLVLAIACTGFAQILYFRLIERTGASNATTVTFLIPLFGLLWGNLFLGELIEMKTLYACLVILTGTALTTGLIRSRKQQTANRN